MKCTMFAVLAASVLSVSAFGLAIQFDFGTSQGSYNGAIAPGYSYDPAYWENNYWGTPVRNFGGLDGLLTRADGTSWNAISSHGCLFPSLVYADGSQASNVTLRVCGSKPNWPNWDAWPGEWSGTQSVEYGYGTSYNGVLSTALMQDELYNQGSHFAVAVTGLPAGTYTLLAMKATPGAEDRSSSAKAGVFSNVTFVEESDGEFMYIGNEKIGTGYMNDNLKLMGDFTTGNPDATAWVLGQNYVMTTVTTTSESDYIIVMMVGHNASLAGLQIIQVIPEPATMSLLALGGLALLRRRRA